MHLIKPIPGIFNKYRAPWLGVANAKKKEHT